MRVYNASILRGPVFIWKIRSVNEDEWNVWDWVTLQVSAKASNLNSNDVFVVTAAKQLATWVWCGEGASRKERKVGALLAEGLLKPQDSLPLAEDRE